MMYVFFFDHVVFDHAVPQPLLLTHEPSEETVPTPSPVKDEKHSAHSRYAIFFHMEGGRNYKICT